MQAGSDPANTCVLIMKGGSSIIKFALYEVDEPRRKLLSRSASGRAPVPYGEGADANPVNPSLTRCCDPRP